MVLMHALGYDVSAAVLAQRLNRRGGRREVFVAVDDESPVGWVAVSIDEPFVEGFGAQLEGLVVDESARSRGVGARLLQVAESWACERGCEVMRVHSNVVRERAHIFYARHGYATSKAQRYFCKPLQRVF